MSDPATVAADLHPCSAVFEPWIRPLSGTHTCCKLADHDGQHLCPVCHSFWAVAVLPEPEGN